MPSPNSKHRLFALQFGTGPGAIRSPGAGEGPAGGWIPDDSLWDGATLTPEQESEPESLTAPTSSDSAIGTPARQSASSTGSARTPRPPGRLTRRWVPESLHGARIDPGKRAALLLTLVAAIAAVAAAVGVWRDRPEPRPIESVAMTRVTDTAAANSGGRSSSAASPIGLATAARSTGASANVSGPIVVSVTGAVRRPGLVRLAAGSRVADAIAKAGGTTGAANITGLNLAAKLTDGASVVVSDAAGSASSVSGNRAADGPASAAQPASTGSGAPVGKLDLNAADVAALDALPGVGPVTAAAIVAWREKNGRFTSLEQLQEIQGIGPAKYAALVPLVKV